MAGRPINRTASLKNYRGIWRKIWAAHTLHDSAVLPQGVCACVNAVPQSCPTLCHAMACGLPGPSVHGIFLARIVGWVALSYSRAFSWPRSRTRVSWISPLAGGFFTTLPSGKHLRVWWGLLHGRSLGARQCTALHFRTDLTSVHRNNSKNLEEELGVWSS